MCVVELIGRYEMAHPTHRGQFVRKSGVVCDGRMQEEIAVAEAHHGHARRERERKPYACRRQILERAIDHADIRPERLISVDRLVERGSCATHVGILPRDEARTHESASGHVWTAPTGQGISLAFCLRAGASHVSGLFAPCSCPLALM